MKQGAQFGAILVVVVLVFGGIEYYTYSSLSARLEEGRAAQGSQSAQITSLQGNLAGLHRNLTAELETIASMQSTMSSLQDEIAAEQAAQSSNAQLVNSLQAQLQNLTSRYDAFVANLVVGMKSYEVQYFGNGEANHTVGVPFDPKIVTILDVNTGVRATVFHTANSSWDNIYVDLNVYQFDNYGEDVFYSDGQYNISLVGSAPNGTLNNVGELYQAFFYG